MSSASIGNGSRLSPKWRRVLLFYLVGLFLVAPFAVDLPRLQAGQGYFAVTLVLGLYALVVAVLSESGIDLSFLVFWPMLLAEQRRETRPEERFKQGRSPQEVVIERVE